MLKVSFVLPQPFLHTYLLEQTYRTLAYVSSSSATIQAMSAKVGTEGPSLGRKEGKPGSS